MNRYVTRLYRATGPETEGWYSIREPEGRMDIPDGPWRRATRLEVLWHDLTVARFSWVGLFVGCGAAVFADKVGATQIGLLLEIAAWLVLVIAVAFRIWQVMSEPRP